MWSWQCSFTVFDRHHRYRAVRVTGDGQRHIAGPGSADDAAMAVADNE
jgi:hypothetical protein